MKKVENLQYLLFVKILKIKMIKKNIIKIKFLKRLFIKFKLFIFLLRLLFTKQKKIRFLLFDTLHLKQFFDQDNWQDILVNHPKNKPISNLKNISNETALLIPGRLRCWEKSKELIYSIAEKNKVFIMTDNSDKKIINDINHKNIVAINIDNSIYKESHNKIPNLVLSQFFKLKCVINEIYKFEKLNSFFFKNFIKIRTDFYYYNSENLMNMTRENNENYLFSQSDLHFSGRREFFLPLKNFYEFAEWSYLNDFHNLKYMPVNPTQIINSDPGSTRFAWLKFPKKIVETLDTRPSSEYLHQKINKNYEDALKYKYDEKDEFKLTGAADYPPTEQSFASYLNLLGVPCKTHLKFLGFIMNNPDKQKMKIEWGNQYRSEMENLRKKDN